MMQTRKFGFAAAPFVAGEIVHVDGGQSAGH
jgi:hypothetical protein